ncbi:MAG TPA: DUF58 domain-containing protein [Gemmatimonadaceae bacterium]|nr:DUF58 domain-containing protein [Gemmatimonadaceae bacterium]
MTSSGEATVPHRRRMVLTVYPTGRAAALVLALSLLWLFPRIGLALAVAGLVAAAACLLFDYVRLPKRGDFTIERRAPDTLGLGDATPIQYRVSSRWPWPVRAQLFDRFPSGLAGSVAADAFVIEARADVAIDVQATGASRGAWHFGDVAVRVVGPLGLMARIIVVRVPPQTTTVVPSLTNVRRFRLLALQQRLSDVGVRALKRRGEGSAFAGMRDYVPGDDPRFVDWKATARHGRLISREHTIERSQVVISMIDCGRAMTQLAGQYSRLDHVLSASLVLSDVAATSGDRVGLIAFDDAVRAVVAPQRGRTALRSLRAAISGLEARVVEPDYAAAFRVLATSQPRRALVVFFTDVIDVRTARSFVGYANRAGKRHALVVVAIENDALIEASRPATVGATALFRSAAAEELVREREEALARMRSAGIAVLDVSPTHMATAVVNRYLEIKARGLL